MPYSTILLICSCTNLKSLEPLTSVPITKRLWNTNKSSSHGIIPPSATTVINSGGLHLAEPDLTAGRLVSMQAANLVGEIWAKLEILKACCRSKYSISLFV